MDDGVVVETEHVEKITRTSSLQQVYLEDSVSGTVDENIEVHEVNSRNHVNDSVHHDSLPVNSIDVMHDHSMDDEAAFDEIKRRFEGSDANVSAQEPITGVHINFKKLDDNVQLAVSSDIQDNEKDVVCRGAMQNAVNDSQYDHEVEPHQIDDDSFAKCNAELKENGLSVNGDDVKLSNSSDLNAELGCTAKLTLGQTDAIYVPTKFTSLDSDQVTLDTSNINKSSDQFESGCDSNDDPGSHHQQENSDERILRREESNLNKEELKLAATANEKSSSIEDSVRESVTVRSETVDGHHINNLSNSNMLQVKNDVCNGTVSVDSQTEKDQSSDVSDSQKFRDTVDIHADICDTTVDTKESAVVECEVDETCQSTTASSLLQGPSLQEMCSNIKEPEEHDHHKRCHLGADNGISECTDDRKADQTGSSVEAENDNWLFLLGNDKLKKRVLRKGEEGKRPGFGQLVTVRCSGRLHDGTEIDRYDSLQLVLGDGDFIQAFDMCISHMDRGEICELVTAARYAYGELGREPDVPTNSALSYEIELQSYEDEPEFSTLPLNDRIQRSNVKRERGNYLYARNECSRAIDAYTKALRIIDDTTETHAGDSGELQMLVDTRVKCYNNLAAAQMKMEDWDGALQSINPVLRVQPANVKALYRKGKCLINKGDQDAAISILKKAVKLEPKSKIIQQELSRLEKWTESQKKSQRAMYKKMLGETKPSAAKKEGSTVSWWYGAALTVLAVSAVSVVMYRRFMQS